MPLLFVQQWFYTTFHVFEQLHKSLFLNLDQCQFEKNPFLVPEIRLAPNTKREICIFQRINNIFLFIDVDGWICPVKDKIIEGHEYAQVQMFSTWDECGEYICTF